MSRLHDELAGGSKTGCTLCGFLAAMDSAIAAEWQAELAMPTRVIHHVAVVNALAKRGVDITEASVRRHRARHVAG